MKRWDTYPYLPQSTCFQRSWALDNSEYRIELQGRDPEGKSGGNAAHEYRVWCSKVEIRQWLSQSKDHVTFLIYWVTPALLFTHCWYTHHSNLLITWILNFCHTSRLRSIQRQIFVALVPSCRYVMDVVIVVPWNLHLHMKTQTLTESRISKWVKSELLAWTIAQ